MGYSSLSSLVPKADDLLALEVEELAGVLLTHLNSCDGSPGSSVFQRGRVSYNNFFNEANLTGPLSSQEYGDRQKEVNRALMEAWAWLESEGFLVKDTAPGPGWFFISRRAKLLKSRDDFDAYRKASLLPKGQLHPFIAREVYPAFLRGKYDTAIFEAFREVEVAVREAGKFGPGDLGSDLMRKAFADTPPGPLTDQTLPVAEQKAMSHLFAGAIGLYKNPQSHRRVQMTAEVAAEVIVFASLLLRIVRP